MTQAGSGTLVLPTGVTETYQGATTVNQGVAIINATTDPARIAAVIARPINGVLAKTLISSAAEAKRIQSTLKFGTAIIDVDFALPPKVKMSFLKAQKDAPQAVEDLDLACGQALN